MPALAIPIWPFEADWTNPISETLSWLTAIQQSPTGSEQRQSLRITPRRQLDFPVQLYGEERAYFEVMLSKFGRGKWYVPLPQDEVRVEAGALLSGTTSLPIDANFHEIIPGSFLVVRASCYLIELVEVTSVGSGTIGISALVNSYPAGAAIAPAFVGQISEAVKMSRITTRIFSGTVRFTALQQNAWPIADAALATYALTYTDFPVLTQEPNAAEPLDYSWETMVKTVDDGIGIPVFTDTALRPFTTQKLSWFLYGKQERQQFRDFLYAARGKTIPFWVPTFNDDLNYDQYPDPFGLLATVPGKTAALLFNRDGTFMPISTAGKAGLIWKENFDGNTVVYKTSFMSLKRFDVDDFEFLHYGNDPAVTTVTALMRDAPDTRTATEVTSHTFSHSGYVETGSTVAATNTPTDVTAVITITGPEGGA